MVVYTFFFTERGVAAIICDTTGNAVRQGYCYTCLAIGVGYFGRVTNQGPPNGGVSNGGVSRSGLSGQVRPRQGTESAISGCHLHWRLSTGFFAFISVQFSKTGPLKSGESSEKSSGENRVKSCHVCGCHGFFGPETCPSFFVLFVLFGTFPIFPGISRFVRRLSGDFPDWPFSSFTAY